MRSRRKTRSRAREARIGVVEDADAEADAVVDEANGHRVHRDVSAAEVNTCFVTAQSGRASKSATGPLRRSRETPRLAASSHRGPGPGNFVNGGSRYKGAAQSKNRKRRNFYVRI